MPVSRICALGSWRRGVGFAVVVVLLLFTGRADAAEPPIESLSPPNGASLPNGTDLNQGPLHFTCPTATTESSFLPVTWRDYAVRVATSPEVGPDGGLATAFTIAYGIAVPLNAQETECRNSQAPRVLPPGTYYWQAIRFYADTPGHIATGPIWSFTVQAPAPPAPPAPAPEPTSSAQLATYVACGLTSSARRSGSCPRRSKIGLFFQSPVTTGYKVCIRFPSRQVRCSENQQASAGQLYVNAVRSHAPGQYAVTWFVDGRRIQRYFWRQT